MGVIAAKGPYWAFARPPPHLRGLHRDFQYSTGDCQYTIADTIAPKTKKIRKDNRSGCKIIVNNSPEPECEIGEDVNS
jgi:hypothetical protein